MRVNKTFGLGLFALSMSAAVMVGCASDDLSSNESEEANGNGGDLVVDMQSDAVSLDVHGSNDTASSNVTSNIFETLVTQDENLDLQPGLAEDWEQISETEWEFQLREGVTFHDGTEFD